MATALVFAVDTLVRFRNGRILVHTTTRRLPAFETDQPMLIGWICQFARAGAALRIVVPDIEKCIAAYAANDRTSFASRRETWDWWPENATRLEDFLAYAGVGAEPAHLFEAHKYGYDVETLTKVLAEAGFEGIGTSAYMGSEDPVLRIDDVSAVAKARYGDEYYSLFVEARAPGA